MVSGLLHFRRSTYMYMRIYVYSTWDKCVWLYRWGMNMSTHAGNLVLYKLAIKALARSGHDRVKGSLSYQGREWRWWWICLFEFWPSWGIGILDIILVFFFFKYYWCVYLFINWEKNILLNFRALLGRFIFRRYFFFFFFLWLVNIW